MAVSVPALINEQVALTITSCGPGVSGTSNACHSTWRNPVQNKRFARALTAPSPALYALLAPPRYA